MIALLVSLLALGPQTLSEQRAAVPDGTIISSVDVSGFDIDRFSPGLRSDIRLLAGSPLAWDRLDELVGRIEAERPRRVAALRVVMEAEGRARVIFIVGPRADQDNVNTRYLVDQVEITGVPDDDVPEELRKDVQAIVGKNFDSDQAEQLRLRIEREMPRYQVSSQIRRGRESGRVRVVFSLERRELPRWLRFEPLRADGIFHSEQGWGSYLTLGMGGGDIRFTPTVAIDNDDDLVEEYSGFGLRFETRRMGTRRLGASLEWSTFEPTWRAETVAALAANPAIPTLYDTRTTVTPLVKFALTPELTVSAGVGITELDPFESIGPTRMANAAIAAVDFLQRFRTDDHVKQRVEARFQVRSGSPSLESDFSYNRYLGQGAYNYDRRRHHVLATGMAGSITGTAPLFERFTLGDSTTLRGWDKYDIAPAGGSRMFYASVEYRYTGLAVFLDVGSVWDAPADNRVRVSTGVGFHAGPTFATIGFPLNTDNLTTVVSIGLRFAESRFKWW